jgi:hypothetical protein
LTVIPNENENLQLETGETFFYSKRVDNIPFILSLIEFEPDIDGPELDKDGNPKENCIGLISYHEKIKSADGVVDEPSQITGSISVRPKDFDFILESLRQGHVPSGVSLGRDFNWKEDLPIKATGHFGDTSEWSNKDKENRMILIHNISFGYSGLEKTDNDDELEVNEKSTLDSVEDSIIRLIQTIKSMEEQTHTKQLKWVIWGIGFICMTALFGLGK